MALTDLGIDRRVAGILEEQGIQGLYPPQEEAWAALRDGSNIVVAIPTASGKSLIAYLAILHRWLMTGKKALYIVPLRALASEKLEELQAFKALGLTVGVSTGDLDEKDPRLGRHDVIVCTSEKADSLLRHRTGWVEDIGCVVADELHLLHDPGRGPTLEVILSRFRSLLPHAQIVGLSATIANGRELADWLGARLVTSEWRPVDLRVGTYLGDNLHFEGQAPRELPAAGDPVTSLVEDAILQGGQALVFVSTRRSAEAQAQRLAGPVRDLLTPEQLAALEEATAGLDEPDASPTAKKLQKLVRAGVAYHTAGLDGAQRRFVERGFRTGRIKVICATPTLAAGVNTPARRVILRDLRRFEAGFGSRPLPVMEVKQMMGRAGRPRYDPYGEAVLLVKSVEEKDAVVTEYLHGEPEPVTSKLAADAALRIHTLASIAGGYCASQAALADFLSHTFWAQQTEDWIIRDRVEDVLWFLEEHGFVERDGGALKATLFGQRTSDLYIDPLSALRLRTALASETAEPTGFALLQVVAGCPDVYPLYLRKNEDWVQATYYQRFPELLVPDEGELETALSYTKTAQLLWDWTEETTMQALEERYQVGPGDVRLRLDTAGWLLHAFRELARALRPDWQRPLTDLGLRLEHGIKGELLRVIRLRGIGRVRARTLFRHGFRRPEDLKGVPVDRLASLPGFGERLARDLLKQVGDDPGGSRPEADGVEADPGSRPADRGQMSLRRFQ